MKQSPSPEARSPRRGLFRRVWAGTKMVARGPVDAAAPGEIARGAGLIRSLIALLRSGTRPDDRLRLDEAGRIDLEATAFLHGLTPGSLEQRMQERRRQTKRAAYALFAIGMITFVGWIVEALQMRFSVARLMSAIEFLPFCAFLFVSAFRCAWINWQLRTRRLGSALAFLRTDGPFLPN